MSNQAENTNETGGQVHPMVIPLTLADVRSWWDKQRSDIPDDAAIGYLFRAVEYSRAGMEKRRPAYVPCRVRLCGMACGDGPFASTRAPAGDYDCTANQYGAVSITATNGQQLGLRLNEFEPIAWAVNSKV